MLLPLQEENFFQTVNWQAAKLLMVIERKQTGAKGMFYAELDGTIVAQLSYRVLSPDRIILEHTEVNDARRGRGIGRQLVEKAVFYARDNNLKIIPLCPFAKAIIGKKPEWQDLIFHPR